MNGRLDPDAARAERITVSELEQALRQHGVDDLGMVRRAVVETNGQISVIRRDA